MKVQNSFWLIIVSILFTFVIWVQTKLTVEQTSTISLPIQYNNQTEETTLLNLPEKADFRVFGTGLNILKLKLFHVYAQYNKSPDNEDEYGITLDNFNTDLPFSVKIVSIEPLTNNTTRANDLLIISSVSIILNFEDSKSRDLFTKMNYRLSTDRVDVLLPQNLVKKVRSLKTQTISKDMLKSDTVKLKLIYPTNKIELKSEPVYLFRLDDEDITKVISNIPIQSNSDIDYFPKEVSVRIKGTIEEIKSISSGLISARLNSAEEQENQISIIIDAPKDIEIVDYSPQKVTKVK